jgi:hypothetical protein
MISLIFLGLCYQDDFHIEALAALLESCFTGKIPPSQVIDLTPHVVHWLSIIRDDELALPADEKLWQRFGDFGDNSPNLFDSLRRLLSAQLTNAKPHPRVFDSLAEASEEATYAYASDCQWVFLFDAVHALELETTFMYSPGSRLSLEKRAARTGSLAPSPSTESVYGHLAMREVTLVWIVGSKGGVMTLFLFIGEHCLAISDRRAATFAIDQLNQYFNDVRVYAAAWNDAALLPGDCYRISERMEPIDRRPIDEMLLKALRARQAEKWPGIHTYSDALAESVEWPAYFLTACGFELHEAAAVCIVTQASSVLDHVLQAPYTRTAGIAGNRWREAILALRLFGGFVHSLVNYLEAINAGQRDLASLRNRVFGALPVVHDYFVWATLKLMCKLSADLLKLKLKGESDGIMEYIAIVLGPECGTFLDLGVSRPQLEEWARHNPGAKFERPSATPIGPLWPGAVIRRLRQLLGPYERAGAIPSIQEFAATKRKVAVLPKYQQYVMQVFLCQLISL